MLQKGTTFFRYFEILTKQNKKKSCRKFLDLRLWIPRLDFLFFKDGQDTLSRYC